MEIRYGHSYYMSNYNGVYTDLVIVRFCFVL
jgi:hypothetical protein